MPTWGEILIELANARNQGNQAPFDFVRRKYLIQLYQKTKRNTILYATAWTKSGLSNSAADLLIITEEDVQGLMEVIHGLSGNKLDLIIHSPGGSPEATEAFVSYLRSKFDDIRVIIPYAAMSAATMLACSADKIVMGKHSFIGPIDPQMLIATQFGRQAVPAQAILDQFHFASDEAKSDSKKLASWLPLLGQYSPGLLVQCMNALDLSEELVSEWLQKYMFKKRKDRMKVSKKIARFLSNHTEFKTHSRHLNRDKAKEIGLEIEDLEKDQELQDLVLSLFHSVTHTFGGTPAIKIIENHLGKAYINQQQQIVLQSPLGVPPNMPFFPLPPLPPAPPASPPDKNQ